MRERGVFTLYQPPNMGSEPLSKQEQVRGYLECLSKPARRREVVKADERTAEGEERLMEVGRSLITDAQAPVAVQPGEGPLHDPAVAPQTLAGLDAFAGDANLDMPATQGPAAAGIVVPFVGMQLGWPFAPLPGGTFDRRHRVEHLLKHLAVVAVGAGRQGCEREPVAIDEQMVFGARFAPIDGVGPSLFAPLFAGTLALSTLARSQSIRSASPKRSRSIWCSCSQTPAACQARKRRQHVTPDPQPISVGSSSQAMPERRTKMMPVRQARSGMRGRPPLGLGGSSGSKGSTIDQSSSGTRGVLILPDRASPVPWF